ncbi:MAG: DegT/DnrJ/EryC1/StrS family aminotransferase [Nitrososphaeria archaeon]
MPINRPIIGKEELEAVRKVVEDGYFTDQAYDGGKYVREFEKALESYLGIKHVVAVNSGTSALIAALLAAKVGAGDEVLVPSLTFVATANAVRAVGAKPVFVDVDEYYTMDPKELRKKINRRVKAIIPVHLYGHVANMDEINEIASEYGITVIEDAAQSLGSTYKGKMTGTLGRMGCFSFYPGKVMTTGEGGAVATDDDELADALRKVRNHGFSRDGSISTFGLNMRMQQINAAIGVVQLKRLPGFLEVREKNAYSYMKALMDVSGVITLPPIREGAKYNWYLFTILHPKRQKALEALKKAGIDARVYYDPPVHKTPVYSFSAPLPKTEMIANTVISLPANPMVKEDIIETAAKVLKESLN